MLDRKLPRGGWTPQDDDTLRNLWVEGKVTAEEIGMSRLSRYRTKNMVIGRAHKLGLPNRYPSPRKTKGNNAGYL